jgi:hypothetical protein
VCGFLNSEVLQHPLRFNRRWAAVAVDCDEYEFSDGG